MPRVPLPGISGSGRRRAVPGQPRCAQGGGAGKGLAEPSDAAGCAQAAPRPAATISSRTTYPLSSAAQLKGRTGGGEPLCSLSQLPVISRRNPLRGGCARATCAARRALRGRSASVRAGGAGCGAAGGRPGAGGAPCPPSPGTPRAVRGHRRHPHRS